MAKEKDAYDLTEVPSAVELVVKAVRDCENRYHNAFIEKVERRYNAYRALSDPKPVDEEDAWRSQVTTPYVLQTCEGMLATMLEPHPRFNVQPRPKPDEPLNEVLERLLAVNAIDDTLRYALDRDHFPQKQRDFMQQDMIAGLSVLKSYWHVERRTVTKLVPTQIEIADHFGQVYDTVNTHEESQVEDALVADDACSEVVDVRDFFWPSQAPNVAKAEYLVHRTWESYAELKRKQDLGIYKNVEKLKETSTGSDSNVTARERRLRGVDRTQNLHEILEYWTPERLIVVGDRQVELRNDANPLWNGRMPFTLCSSMPDGFQIPGLSVVEALAQLQEMLWMLQNQRLDVVRMMANLIVLVRSDVEDTESLVWGPGRQWLLEDIGQVDTLKIDPAVANITLQAESLLKGDLQNIMGGLPYAGGSDSQTIDQQTATGVSIITTIAQRIIQARKQHYLWAFSDLGRHFLLLYQQYLREERVVRIVGRKGAEAYHTIAPLQLQGDYDITIDVTSDSLMRQERRAEGQSLLQIAAQVQPIFAQSGTPLNLKAFMDKTLDAYDELDKERFYLPPKAAGAIPGATGGAEAPSNQQPQQPEQGVTNTALAAGPTSPSTQVSVSPEASMQRMMSQSGGISNQGGGGTPGG